jgi:hypothetical protein
MHRAAARLSLRGYPNEKSQSHPGIPVPVICNHTRGPGQSVRSGAGVPDPPCCTSDEDHGSDVDRSFYLAEGSLLY